MENNNMAGYITVREFNTKQTIDIKIGVRYSLVSLFSNLPELYNMIFILAEHNSLIIFDGESIYEKPMKQLIPLRKCILFCVNDEIEFDFISGFASKNNTVKNIIKQKCMMVLNNITFNYSHYMMSKKVWLIIFLGMGIVANRYIINIAEAPTHKTSYSLYDNLYGFLHSSKKLIQSDNNGKIHNE